MAILRSPADPSPTPHQTDVRGRPASLPRRTARPPRFRTGRELSPGIYHSRLDARAGVRLPGETSLSVAGTSPAENGDRGCSAAATLGQIGMFTDTPNPQESDGTTHRIRQQLVNAGLRPREADARATIAQTHLSYFTQRGGASA